MNKKILAFFFTASFFAINASAQTIEENIKKRMNDPQTEEKAAKADAMLIDKNIISNRAEKAQKTKTNPLNKKYKCNKKGHHKS